MSVMIVSLPS